MNKTPEQLAEECSEQFTEKQKLLLKAARVFAYAFVKTIPLVDNAIEGRVNAFMTGYLKGLKDCGFDLFDAKSIEGVEANND